MSSEQEVGSADVMPLNARPGVRLFMKRALTLLPAMLLLAGGSLFAQETVSNQEQGTGETKAEAQAPSADTRSERLKQRREAKRETLTPPEPHMAEKYLKKFDAKGSQSIDDTNFWGFYPRIDWIARGSGAALGVRYWNPEAIGPAHQQLPLWQ